MRIVNAADGHGGWCRQSTTAPPMDASLDFFARKSPRSLRDLAEKRALSARRLFFVDGGSINVEIQGIQWEAD